MGLAPAVDTAESELGIAVVVVETAVVVVLVAETDYFADYPYFFLQSIDWAMNMESDKRPRSVREMKDALEK